MAVPPAAPRAAGAGPGAACPRCAATVRPGAPWCTQCFLDLSVPEPVTPALVAEPVAEPAPVLLAVPPPVPLAVPAQVPGDAAAATWPCTGCGAATPLTDDVCAACGLGFLAALSAADATSVVLPVVGDLVRLGRGQRTALALGLVLLLVLLATGLSRLLV